jgi:hypothetical protein
MHHAAYPKDTYPSPYSPAHSRTRPQVRAATMRSIGELAAVDEVCAKYLVPRTESCLLLHAYCFMPRREVTKHSFLLLTAKFRTYLLT